METRSRKKRSHRRDVKSFQFPSSVLTIFYCEDDKVERWSNNFRIRYLNFLEEEVFGVNENAVDSGKEEEQ
jgi:hypothetical protein